MGTKIIGKRLRNEMTFAGYTQTSFAEKTGIARPTINKLCNDKYDNTPSDYIIEVICSALNIPRERLTGEEISYYEKEDPENKILDLLKNGEKIELLNPDSQEIMYRLHGEHCHIDISENELISILSFLKEKLFTACNDYVEMCYTHDANKIREQLAEQNIIKLE